MKINSSVKKLQGDNVFVYSKNSSGTHKIYTAQEAEQEGHHLCKLCQRHQLKKLQMRSIPQIYAQEKEVAQRLYQRKEKEKEAPGK